MDISKYSFLKAKGYVVARKYSNKVGLEVVSFDATTGEKLPPEFQELQIDMLRANATANRATADELDVLIKDLQGLSNNG